GLADDAVDKMREGVWLADGRTGPMAVKVERAGREVTSLKIRVVERHHRQLRRVLAKVGCAVQRMILVRLRPLRTQGLSKGGARAGASRGGGGGGGGAPPPPTRARLRGGAAGGGGAAARRGGPPGSTPPPRRAAFGAAPAVFRVVLAVEAVARAEVGVDLLG